MQQNAKAEQAKQDALRAKDFSLYQLNQQQAQLTSAAAQEAAERARQGIRERAMIAVSAGEYGVTGNTLERLAATSMTQEGYDTGVLRTNEMNQNTALINERKALDLRTEAAIANADASKVGTVPMLVGAGLGALQGYQTGQGLSAAYQDSGLALQVNKGLGYLGNLYNTNVRRSYPDQGQTAATNVLINTPQLKKQNNNQVKPIY